MTKKASILIVDDEQVFLESLAVFFRRADFDVGCARTGAEALELFELQNWDVVALDMVLPDKDGIHLMRLMIEQRPSTPIILMTGYGTIETAIEATRLGAFDYVTKPFKPSKLEMTVAFALIYKKSHTLLSSALKRGLKSLLPSAFDRSTLSIDGDAREHPDSSAETDALLEKIIAFVGQSFVRSFPLVAQDFPIEGRKREQDGQT